MGSLTRILDCVLIKKKFIFLLNIVMISSSLFCNAQKPLKVLFVVGFFPPDSGVAVLNQITGLIDRGCTVSVFTLHAGKLEKAHPDVYKYNLLNKIYCNDDAGKFGRYYYKYLRSLPDDLETYDIIYCQFGHRGLDFVNLVKKYKLKAKVVICFRGADITSYLKDNPHIYDELFAEGDCFLPVCDYFKKVLIKHGCDTKKIIVHHSAIDCDKFFYRKKLRKKEEPVKIVTVGRFVEKKGIEYSIQAVAQLLQKYPYIEYYIIGFGPLEDKIVKLINELGIEKNVHLIGYCNQDQIASTLHYSDIFVLAAVTAHNKDSEGIPNVLKEAMAKGLPVISTYHSGISELVENGTSGFLVAERDTMDMAKKIAYLIDNPDVCIQFGRLGREKVRQEYDKEKLNDRLMKIFTELLSS